jgi:hypothetical protein
LEIEYKQHIEHFEERNAALKNQLDIVMEENKNLKQENLMLQNQVNSLQADINILQEERNRQKYLMLLRATVRSFKIKCSKHYLPKEKENALQKRCKERYTDRIPLVDILSELKEPEVHDLLKHCNIDSLDDLDITARDLTTEATITAHPKSSSLKELKEAVEWYVRDNEDRIKYKDFYIGFLDGLDWLQKQTGRPLLE